MVDLECGESFSVTLWRMFLHVCLMCYTQLRKLRPHDELLSLLADAADGFDAEALGRDSMLSNRQREMLMVCATNTRSLRQLARSAVSAALLTPSGPSSIDRLPLPPYLKQYLLYNV